MVRKINNYKQHIFESVFENIPMVSNIALELDILESIVTDADALLKSIEAEEIDLYTTFHLNPDLMKNDYSIQELYDNDKFNNALSKKDYKKNELESTDETETFIEETIHVKFFSIYKNNQSELEQPKYIVYQSKTDGDWGSVKAYEVNGDMTKFYNKLTNKSIEINKGDKTYIYNTSNSGNNWLLQKHADNQDTKTFKDDMSNDDIKAVLIDDEITITIIT